jgi:predicted AlkP superfamily pyrophosphatase or phosphodiesterase
MSQRPQLQIFVLIDALGWRFVEGRDFLIDLLPYRSPLRTVLGFSSGAIPTILTGVPPAVTGHWNLFYYDPTGSPFRWLRFVQFLPDAVLDHRVTRKIIKELGRRILGMGPLFECSVSPRFLPWFNYVEKKNIYDAGGIAGSSSIFDQLKRKGIPYRVYSYHHLSDAEILRQAVNDIQSREASFFFLYLSEMDMFLHMHCKEPENIEKRLQWYDASLRRVFEAARQIDPDASMTVISDHGMTPVEHRYDVVKGIDDLGLKVAADYLAVYDSTMARFWFFNDSARQAIRRHLENLPCGRIVPDQELRQLGVFFTDRRFGELIFLLHPGWLLSKSDFNGKGWMPNGMHGYHPEDSYSDGIFLSSSEPPVPMQTIADVYACMQNAAVFGKVVEKINSL